MDDKTIRILLIEDSVFATRHTEKMLDEAKSPQFDAELKCADTLSKGMKRLAEGGIDIVLLDLTLPDSDELHTFMSVYDQVPKTPIVVMSGIEDDTLAMEAVQKGAQDYLVKGQVDCNLLKRSILYAIERKQVEEELRKRTAELQKLINLMSGREVRMAELKRIIKELRLQIESAGLTPVADDPLKEAGKMEKEE